MPNNKRRIRRAARRQGIRPELLLAQLTQESGLNPDAVSPAGARGIAQFMPETAKGYGVDLYDGDPRDDIRGAARHMRDLLDRFGGDERKALAAYNAGAGAVEKYGGVPPYRETQNYVQKILGSAGTPNNSKEPPTLGASYRTVPGVDNSDTRQQLLIDYLAERGKPGALLGLKGSLDSAQDVPARRELVRQEPTESNRTSRPGDTSINAIMAEAERRGLHVGENPTRGPVGQHAEGSYHYTGKAADITGDPKELASFKRWLRKNFGADLEELIYNAGGGKNLKNGRRVGPGFYSGHLDHLHVADDDQ